MPHYTLFPSQDPDPNLVTSESADRVILASVNEVNITTLGGNDTIFANNDIDGLIAETGEGDDYVRLETTIFADISTGNGDDAVRAVGSTDFSAIDTGAGNDRVFVEPLTLDDGLSVTTIAPINMRIVLGDGDDFAALALNGLAEDPPMNGFYDDSADGRTGAGEIAQGVDYASYFGVHAGDGNDHVRLSLGEITTQIVDYFATNAPYIPVVYADMGEGDDRLDARWGNTDGFTNSLEAKGGAGNDTIFGGNDDDRIYGGDDDDLVFGMDGDDTLNGVHGNDTLKGGDGDDILTSFWGNNLLVGGNGRDYLILLHEAGDLRGGYGDDVLDGSSEGDFLSGQGGDDHIQAYAGDDTIHTGHGNDYVSAGDGDDLIFGLDGENLFYGEAGNDTIKGGFGSDTIIGDDGRDVLLGGNGNDVLEGGAGHDILNGQGGVNTLDGGIGNDRLQAAEAGDETYMFGGEGHDQLRFLGTQAEGTGGAGSDWFIFGQFDELQGDYRIHDFDSAEDNIRLLGHIDQDELTFTFVENGNTEPDAPTTNLVIEGPFGSITIDNQLEDDAYWDAFIDDEEDDPLVLD